MQGRASVHVGTMGICAGGEQQLDYLDGSCTTTVLGSARITVKERYRRQLPRTMGSSPSYQRLRGPRRSSATRLQCSGDWPCWRSGEVELQMLLNSDCEAVSSIRSGSSDLLAARSHSQLEGAEARCLSALCWKPNAMQYDRRNLWRSERLCHPDRSSRSALSNPLRWLPLLLPSAAD